MVVPIGWELLTGLVGPVPVVMVGVLAKDWPEVPFAVDQQPVGALGSCGAYPSRRRSSREGRARAGGRVPSGRGGDADRDWHHAQIDAAVDGACCGEPELAIRLAPSAAGMLVIMDRGFPGVALWRAYTGAGAHLLIRARSCVAAHPIEYLPTGPTWPG
jgi:hypothetical protein